MALRSLLMRFLSAGCLLAAATVVCVAWSIVTFARLSNVVDDTLRESQETIDLAATLATTLEREDDALLLSLTGEIDRAKEALLAQRDRFDKSFTLLMPLMHDPEEKEAASNLQAHVADYRQAGDSLLRSADEPRALESYHKNVNPILRRAVADCRRIRELNFDSMRAAGIQARNEAKRATGVIAAIALGALLLTGMAGVHLARAILGPIRELTRSVEAIRLDDLDQRVPVRSSDELGQLAEGFNRMAETLAEYRHSSLGELLLAKTTLESTLAALPDAVIVADPQGQIVSKNPLATEILKATRREHVTDIQELPLSPEVLQAAQQTLHGERQVMGRPDLSQALSICLKGRPLKMLATVAPIPEFLPRRCGVVIVLDDVTDLARLDELRSELVAVASHELKTPLTALRMNLLLLEEDVANLSLRQQEMLSAATLGVEELAATVEELLDLTRIEAGQLRLQQERIDVQGIMEQVVRSLRPRFEDARIGLHLLEDPGDTTTRGDAARLRIVFANLLTNALKYTPRGGEVSVHITGGTHVSAAGNSGLQVIVTDTGPGIPVEFRQRVFEKFFRVEHEQAADSPGVRGTGIGLYLCRQIVEAHGGSIRCEPGENNHGTRMVINLRMDEEDQLHEGDMKTGRG